MLLSLNNKENPLIQLLLGIVSGRRDSFGRKERKQAV